MPGLCAEKRQSKNNNNNKKRCRSSSKRVSECGVLVWVGACMGLRVRAFPVVRACLWLVGGKWGGETGQEQEVGEVFSSLLLFTSLSFDHSQECLVVVVVVIRRSEKKGKGRVKPQSRPPKSIYQSQTHSHASSLFLLLLPSSFLPTASLSPSVGPWALSHPSNLSSYFKQKNSTRPTRTKHPHYPSFPASHHLNSQPPSHQFNPIAVRVLGKGQAPHAPLAGLLLEGHPLLL